MIISICAVLCVILSIVSFLISALAYIEVSAFKKSTHKIEYIPMPEITKENMIANLDKEIKDEEEDFV